MTITEQELIKALATIGTHVQYFPLNFDGHDQRIAMTLGSVKVSVLAKAMNLLIQAKEVQAQKNVE